jgi:secreted PhoX family phosphatase
MGMHHDGIHFFRHPVTPGSSTTGLLVMNHEYTDDGLLHPDGMITWTAQKVRKAQAAHGVSVIEVDQKAGRWSIVSPAPGHAASRPTRPWRCPGRPLVTA